MSESLPLADKANRLYNFYMSLSLNLYRLQQIDTQLDRVSQRIGEIQAILADASAVQAVEAQEKAVEADLQTQRKQLHQAEHNVQDQRIKIEQTEAALYGGKVRNPKELQDLQLELAALKRHLGVLEDRQLEVMVVVEDLEAAAAQKHQEFLQVVAKTEEQHAQLRGELTSLEKDRERLNVERQAAENTISSSDLAIYQQLRKSRNVLAVAKIADRTTCGACGASLTPSLLQAANAPTQLARCASCGRILYPG